MPSTKDLSNVSSGPGRVHLDVVSAASDLFTSGSSAAVAQFASALAQPLATPAVVAYTAGGSGDSTRLIPSSEGPIYVGEALSEELQDIFKVVDSNDQEIWNPNTRAYVSVASITPSIIGAGFTSGNVTLNFSTPVPAGLSYKVIYGKRATVGNLPMRMAVLPVLRRSADRLRLPEFTRTGFAPTSVAPEETHTTYSDPYLAQWRVRVLGTNGLTSNTYCGSTGFVYAGPQRHVVDSNDTTLRGLPSASFLSVGEKDIRSSTLNTAATLTKINTTLAGTVASPNIVNLNAADFFYITAPSTQSAIRLGLDMLEVTFADGHRGVYIISALTGSPQQALVTTLGGASPAFSAGAASFKWVRPNFFVGGTTEEFSPAVPGQFNLRGGSYLNPGSITIDPTKEISHTPFFFAAGTSSTSRGGPGNWNLSAMTWGAYLDSAPNLGEKRVFGILRGDGGIDSFGGRISGLISSRANPTYYVNVSQALAWNPHQASLLGIELDDPIAKVVTLTLDAAYSPGNGDKISVFVKNLNTSGAGGDSTIIWPTNFKFSGADGDITGSWAPSLTMKFSGEFWDSKFYMTRTDYEE